MSRSHSRSRQRRDSHAIANSVAPDFTRPRVTFSSDPWSQTAVRTFSDPWDQPTDRFVEPQRERRLRLLEDRREFHPDRSYRPATSFRTWQRVLRATTFGSAAQAAFTSPTSVAVCVRRKQREQVLHALRKTGRRGQRPPRRNWLSSIACKRR